MPRSTPSTQFAARVLSQSLAGLTLACLVTGVAAAVTQPTAPKTFDSSYAAPAGTTLTVAAGGDLQGALEKAQPGDTIVLQAGATFTGPFTLPNKAGGSGWIYVVSGNLSNLPAAGTRVSPANAANMPKILAPSLQSALSTVANSHYFRFVGIEIAPAANATRTYQLVAIGNSDTSATTLPDHIIFDRCYVHGIPGGTHRRGIEMDGAYVAVVDSYISDFQEAGADSQGLWAYNTTGPLRIVDNYIEAAGENVMFGGADSRDASLVPADIEVLNNYIFKPLSLIGSGFTTKNLLEIKSAQRILVSGNVFQNSPAAGQGGTAVVITPRNQNGTAPWSVDTDITITGNTLNNIGGGFGILGTDTIHPSQLTSRLLIRDNVLIITGLNGAQSRAFEVYNGGTSYTIDHNTIVWATPTAGNLAVVETARAKVTDFAFTNNLATARLYGFGSPEGEGTVTLNANFTNWTFAKNVVVAAPAGKYPAGNFFPGAVTDLRMMNFTAANYALAANSPYKGAGTDGRDIGADLANAPSTAGLAPNPPANVIVK